MADEADLAFETEQQTLTAALEAQRRNRPVLAAIGHCHYCGEDTTTLGQLFCDPSCSMEWEHEQNLRKRLGLAK